jgi:hypothetical protein
VRRWLFFAVALAIGVAGLFAIIEGRGRLQPADSVSPPLDDIGDASRRQVDRVLRESDRSERAPEANR